jgi:hypothetical protein
MVERPVLVSFAPAGVSLAGPLIRPGLTASGWVVVGPRNCWF